MPTGMRLGVTTSVTGIWLCTSATQRPDSQCCVEQSAFTWQVFCSALASSAPKLQPFKPSKSSSECAAICLHVRRRRVGTNWYG